MPRYLFHPFLIASLMTLGVAARAQAPGRFDGGATLSAPPAHSDDGRFQLHAELQRAGSVAGDRFALNARLAPQAKSVTTLCTPGGVNIFINGFE
jgi:hypothetical protein